MSRIHKQVVSVQKATDGALSGVTLAGSSSGVAITKHSAVLATAIHANGITFNPIYYTPEGTTVAGTSTLISKANSPKYIPVRLHSFTGLTGGDLTFLA
jgi:hypothetical protein